MPNKTFKKVIWDYKDDYELYSILNKLASALLVDWKKKDKKLKGCG